MKGEMLMILILITLGFVVPSAAMASTKILLFENRGAREATFAFVQNTKVGLALTARVTQECWDHHSTAGGFCTTRPVSLRNSLAKTAKFSTPVARVRINVASGAQTSNRLASL